MIECEPCTSRERRLFKLCHQLDEAFRRNSSIGAMNRAYRKVRTGQHQIDRELRDHIGLLYLFEKARPALLKAMKQDQAVERRTAGYGRPSLTACDLQPTASERPQGANKVL